jgi:hypothetical protein
MQTVPPPGDVAACFRAWLVTANTGMLVALLAAPTLFATAGAAAGVALLGGIMAGTAAIGLACRLDDRADASLEASEMSTYLCGSARTANLGDRVP